MQMRYRPRTLKSEGRLEGLIGERWAIMYTDLSFEPIDFVPPGAKAAFRLIYPN